MWTFSLCVAPLTIMQLPAPAERSINCCLLLGSYYLGQKVGVYCNIENIFQIHSFSITGRQ